MTRRKRSGSRAPHSHGRHSHVLNLGGDRVVPVPLSDLTDNRRQVWVATW
jgi:hypothetical protein